MCEVTIIIPNYNGKKYLLPCLEAVYRNTRTKIRVMVVDNGSDDGSIEEAAAKFPQARYEELDKNYGFCRAVNIGIQKADTPYVLLLNNDTRIREGFVEALLLAIREDKRIFSAEAKLLQLRDPSLIDSAGTFYNALGWAFARGRDKAASRYARAGGVFAACAGAAIYRREVFEEIGLFDERHFAYLEDIDIGYRARLFGYRSVYAPRAQVLHAGSGFSGSRYNAFKTRYSARNNIYLIYKNMPLIQILFNLPFLLAGFGAKTVFFFRKGLGREYVRGLREGFSLCERAYKLPFSAARLGIYLRIQLELFGNVLKRLWDL